MISCCLNAAKGCNDRFAFCPFVTLPFLLSCFLFYLVSLLLCLYIILCWFLCYFAFPFILFSLLSCLVSLVTLSLYYSVLFPLLLCLFFYPVLFPCYSVFPLPCLFFIFLPSPLSTCQPVHLSTLCL